jgi:mono/diheme cytochrome c family protein
MSGPPASSTRDVMMIFNASLAARVLFASVVALSLSIPAVAFGQSAQATAPDPTSAGKAVFSKANCMGCHKWHGNGGGGYGGDALSLRKTQLTREQIIETVSCGRPATGMPFFVRGAYDEVKCHGMTREEAGAQMPPEAATFLRPKDIEAVADYVLAHVKGAGEPTYAECVTFFSSTSRVCDIYKKQDDVTTSTGKSQ